MKLNEKSIPFLRGDDFLSGVSLTLDGCPSEKSRLDFIKKKVTNKNVLHVGCVDHSPMNMKAKLEENTWLHKMIMDHSKFCAGVDINSEGIEFLKNEMHIPHVYCCDILNDKVAGVTDRSWDYIILGELLEHIDNPVLFLSKLRANLNLENTKTLITVPNAFYYKNFKGALKSYEDINSDHRYWFTPYTLSKVVMQAGYTVDEIHLTQDKAPTLSRFIPYFILKKYPFLRSKVVVVAK